MKYIKTFESIEEPKPGDYVIVKMPDVNFDGSKNNKGKQFINNNIGKIINYSIYDNDQFLIKYDIDFNTCGFDKSHFQFLEDPDGQRNIDKKYIVAFSPDKDKVKMLVQTNKFNL